MARRRSLPGSLPAGLVPIDTGTVELEGDPDRAGGLMVYVNGVESSYIDLDDAGYLEFEYMQQMLLALEPILQQRPNSRILHLGGAACAFARALAVGRPGLRQVVVELDGELARLAREWFDLPRSPALRIRVGEARATVQTLHPGSFDVIVRDAFAGARVPHHLTTKEFLGELATVLRPGGLYLGNLVDTPPLPMARQEVATAKSVFAHVALAVEPAILRGRRFGNLVILGSDEPIDEGLLARRLLTLPAPVRLVRDADLEAFAAGAALLVDPATQEGAEPSAGAGVSSKVGGSAEAASAESGSAVPGSDGAGSDGVASDGEGPDEAGGRPDAAFTTMKR